MFMNKRSILIILIIIVLGGAIYFFVSNKYRDERSEEQVSASEASEFQPKGLNFTNTYTLTPSKENSDNNVYIDLQYNFSFQYPKDFTVTKFQEGENGNTILVQEKESKESFQIFISPFDEPGPLTKERVLQDLPDLIIKNPEQRVLKNGAAALIFFSEEPSLGEIREIWFVYNGYLYQISTYATLDSLVAEILETWKFH